MPEPVTTDLVNTISIGIALDALPGARLYRRHVCPRNGSPREGAGL
jgi:hypothetical protein